MLPDPTATLLFSPFPFRQTCLFASVCHSVHRYTRDPSPSPSTQACTSSCPPLNSDELSVRKSGLDDMLLVLLNAHHEPLPFTLPAHKRSVRWQMILDTAAMKQGKKQSTLLRGGTPYNLHARARVSLARREPGRSDTGHLRIHRAVLQSEASSLNPRLLLPGRVRGEDGCGLTGCPWNWGKVSTRMASMCVDLSRSPDSTTVRRTIRQIRREEK
jgi:hypothetical protein